MAVGYGRFSSDLQNKDSAADQNAENLAYVRRNFGEDIEFIALVDEAIPGAKVDRDGLNEAMAISEDRRPGIFVVECMSRLGRATVLCLSAINTLVDRGWRFISRKEGIDTNTPMWPATSAIMAVCAEMENAQRSHMVRRGRRAGFTKGYNVGGFPIHYKSILKDPNDPDGPTIVVKREEFQDQIVDYFARVAAGQTIAETNRWANALPGRLGRAEEWELDDGARMIRSERYKGIVHEGETIRVLERSTGNRIARANESEDGMLERIDPLQQFVPPDLWQRANDALDQRHPLGQKRTTVYPRETGSRRSGQWPSGAAHCGWCGSKSHRSHGAGTRYICCQAVGESPVCGNYLSAETDDIRREVLKAILRELDKLEEFLSQLCKELERQVRAAKESPGEATSRDEDSLRELNVKLDRLVDRVEEGHDDPVLWQRIEDRKHEIAEVKKRLAVQATTVPNLKMPTVEDVKKQIADLAAFADAYSDDLLPWLRVLVPHFEIMPARIKGLKKRLLVAKFKLRLIGLLPAQWQAFLFRRGDSIEDNGFARATSRSMTVLITPLPKAAELAPTIKMMADKGMTAEAIGRQLGFDSGVARRAIKLMLEQPGGELEVLSVDALPNLRRKRKAASQPAPRELDKAQSAPDPALAKTCRQVAALRAEGFAVAGIACRLGCRKPTVERCLKQLDDSGPGQEVA